MLIRSLLWRPQAYPPSVQSFVDPTEYQRLLNRLYPLVADHARIDSLADGANRHLDYIGVVRTSLQPAAGTPIVVF